LCDNIISVRLSNSHVPLCAAQASSWQTSFKQLRQECERLQREVGHIDASQMAELQRQHCLHLQSLQVSRRLESHCVTVTLVMGSALSTTSRRGHVTAIALRHDSCCGVT